MKNQHNVYYTRHEIAAMAGLSVDELDEGVWVRERNPNSSFIYQDGVFPNSSSRVRIGERIFRAT